MELFSKGELPVTPALVCLLAANLLDAICTLILLQVYGAEEANPILAHMYRNSPLAFMVVKLGFVFISVLATWLTPSRTAKRWLIRFGMTLYVIVIGYQGVLLMSVRWS